MRLPILLLMTAVVAFCAAPAFSQSIFVWDKDHDKLFADPEGGGNVDATYGVTKALTANGFTFTESATLPGNINSYDILFVIMGTYC
jgi:hypothetical protein